MLWRKMISGMVAFGAIALLMGVAMAATITVDDDGPADYSSIKEAVEAASEGDTVLVRAGTYHEVGIHLKNGMVLQGAGVDSTTIVGTRSMRPSPQILISVSEVDNVRIDGFTLFSSPSDRLLLLFIHNSQPTITNNKFTGGGTGISIALKPYDPTKGFGRINGNTITGNLVGFGIDLIGFSVWPLPAWDFRWNWWGTTDESQITGNLLQKLETYDPAEWPELLYHPWLLDPVTTYEETPGFHYNNIYGNDRHNIFVWVPVRVKGISWGEVKASYK